MSVEVETVAVETPSGRTMTVYSPDENMDWHSLTQGEMYGLGGLSLTDKMDLLGVPHIITRVTYQVPRVVDKKNDVLRDFVSVEATIAPIEELDKAIQRAWLPNVKSLSELRFEPEERIIYNDGSTGIRRQLTKMFHTFELIDVGYDEELKEGSYDQSWAKWQSFSQTREMGDDVVVPCIGANHNGNPLAIFCKRGLYVSHYTHDDYGDSETYYLK